MFVNAKQVESQKQSNDCLQLRRATSIRADGMTLLEKDAIAPVALVRWLLAETIQLPFPTQGHG